MIMKSVKASVLCLLALTAVVCNISCSKPDDPGKDETLLIIKHPIEAKDTAITFNFGTNFETCIEPFNSRTRAASSLSDVITINRIDMWLTNGENVIEVHQTSSDADYGSPSVTIDKQKTYQLIVVAHKGTAPADLSDGIISFPDEKLTDTFFYSDSFNASSETSITLQRIVGMFKLWITDEMPASDTRLTFAISGTGNRWNTSESISCNQTDRTVTFDSPSQSSDGSTKLNLYILPSSLTNESTATIHCQAFASDGTPITEYAFADVPIRANHVTTYKGVFFKEQAFSLSMTADKTWKEYDTIDF